jgi:hypothetical protein
MLFWIFSIEIFSDDRYLVIKGGMKMAQIIVTRNIHGIVLAAENSAIQLNGEGREISLKINRLLPLTSILPL